MPDWLVWTLIVMGIVAIVGIVWLVTPTVAPNGSEVYDHEDEDWPPRWAIEEDEDAGTTDDS